LKVTHFSTYDTAGGAARAALRLHEALLSDACDSQMVVLRKTGTSPKCERVVPGGWLNEARLEAVAALNNAVKYRYRADEAFSYEIDALSAPTSGLLRHARGSTVLNLHWTRELVTSRQARMLAQRTGAAVVWTLMDLAPLTGGCHYMIGCERYTDRCGICPRLRSTREHDRSRRNWNRRRREYAATPLTLVACNRWTMQKARASSLLHSVRCEIIPLAIDTGLFRPIAAPLAREVLGIRGEALVVFCGALQMGQRRKGQSELIEAIERLPAALGGRIDPASVLLLTAGGRDFASDRRLPFETLHLGLLGDDRSLALAYSAADVFVSASLEDAGPMMVNESLACGTPVAAFDIGTAADWVRPGEGGVLARVGDAAGLANAIAAVLADPAPSRLRATCRELAVTGFSPSVVASRYRALYEELASSRRGATA
jgi:glycosyltransferase involved in cell wall biosynthesis